MSDPTQTPAASGFIPDTADETRTEEIMRGTRAVDVELIDGSTRTITLTRLPWTNELAGKTREQMSTVVGNLDAELRLWVCPADRPLIPQLGAKSYYALIKEGRALNDFFAPHVEAQGLMIGILTKGN